MYRSFFPQRKLVSLSERCFGQKPYVSKVENSIRALIILDTSQKLCIVLLYLAGEKERQNDDINKIYRLCVKVNGR